MNIHRHDNSLWEEHIISPRNASIRVTCSNVCCKIRDTKIGDNVNPIICSGDGSKEMTVMPGSHTYPAQCYFDGDYPPDPPQKHFTISTMCTSAQCNAQGTCQKTPIPANSRDACKSTCNSNADCTRGRIIETRP